MEDMVLKQDLFVCPSSFQEKASSKHQCCISQSRMTFSGEGHVVLIDYRWLPKPLVVLFHSHHFPHEAQILSQHRTAIYYTQMRQWPHQGKVQPLFGEVMQGKAISRKKWEVLHFSTGTSLFFLCFIPFSGGGESHLVEHHFHASFFPHLSPPHPIHQVFIHFCLFRLFLIFPFLCIWIPF